jgi:hypothetical protein
MRASVGMRGALAVTAALAAVVTVTGCQGADGGKKAAGAPASKSAEQRTAASPVEAVTAAYKKLSDYRSAKFTMTMSMPAAAAGAAPSATKASGTLGWDPTVMDMSMDASGLGEGATGDVRAKMIDSVMYIDFSSQLKSDPEAAKAFGGKRWIKMDFKALAKEAPGGDDAASDLVSNSFQEQQSPAEQLGSLLQSPGISRVGAETVDGVKTEHYKGHLTVDQVLTSGSDAKALTDDERKQLAGTMKKAGITTEDVDVWVGADSFPVRVDVATATSAGTMKMSEHLSDFSAKAADVQAPPAGETFSLEDMMKELQQSAAASS